MENSFCFPGMCRTFKKTRIEALIYARSLAVKRTRMDARAWGWSLRFAGCSRALKTAIIRILVTPTNHQNQAPMTLGGPYSSHRVPIFWVGVTKTD